MSTTAASRSRPTPGPVVAFLLLIAVVAPSWLATAGAEDAPPVTADPRSQPASTIAPQGGLATPVQFSELVRLGLLMMDSKPPAPYVVPVTAPVAVSTTPWTQPYRTGPRGPSPVVTPPPALGPGDGRVFAVGDSVMLGTQRWLGQVLAGWNLTMDAKVGRRFPEGIDVLRQNQQLVGQVVVICLGHNYAGGGSSYGYIDDIMALTARAQRVVFITQTEWTSAQVEVNRAIYAAAARYPKIVVAPWAETIKANPQWLVDNVHPTTGGAIALANLVGIMVGPSGGVGSAILPIPDDTRPAITIPSSTTSTTRPGGSGSTSTTAPATTTSSLPASTTTTALVSTTTASTAPPP